MFIESLRRNWPLFIRLAFFPLFETTRGSLPRARSHFTFGEPWWSSEMLWLLHRDGLRHHIWWILLHVDLYQINHLIIHDPLTYLVIPHINVFLPLVTHVILSMIIARWLSQWTRTKSCMILNVSTNPLKHKASFDASTVAMYSVFIFERATLSCNSAFKLMIHSATWTHSLP